MRIFSTLAAALLAAPALAATDLQRCRQTTFQFPAACPCIIDRAQAAGITGPTLSKLLVNDTSGVPIQTFQSYGLIFTQCIQTALTGGAGAPPPVPMPAAPAPAPTAPAVTATPAPLTPAPLTPTPLAPTLTPAPLPAQVAAPQTGNPLRVDGTPPPQPDRPPLSLYLREARPAGTWGPVTLGLGDGAQFGQIGVHDGQGRILSLMCQPFITANAPALTLGGFDAAGPVQRATITVTGRGGASIYSGDTRMQSVDGKFLTAPLYLSLARALRSGNQVTIQMGQGGPSFTFGLNGSSRALGPGCADRAGQRWRYAVSELMVPDGGWEAGQMQVRSREALPDDVLIHQAQAPFAPTLLMTCDRRVAVGSPIFGYGATDRVGTINLPEGPIQLNFTEGRALRMVSQPLTEAQIAALSAVPYIDVTFDQNMEPGDFTGAVYRMDGFAEGLAALTCPPPPGPLGPTARTDASGVRNAWAPTDIGLAFDGMSGNPAPVPGAVFNIEAPDLPTLVMQCSGEPYVVDPWPGPRFTVRMDIDGRSWDVEWFSARAIYLPDFTDPAIAQAILTGRVLRMTLTTDTRLDVAYSLDGLRQALSAAGCP